MTLTRTLALVAMGLAVAGCKYEYHDEAETLALKESKKQPSLTDAQKVDLLRQEAHKRGLRWKDFCVEHEEGEPERFLAVAWDRKHEDSSEIDRWIEAGDTQALAAYALYFSIQQAPTHPAKPREQTHANKKVAMCPSELRGE